MYQSESEPWLEFHAIDTDGSAKTDLGASTTGLTLAVARNGQTDISLTPATAASATDHGAGKIHPLGGGKYQIGIATSSISSYTGKIQISGSYTGGIIVGTTEKVSAYNPADAMRGTDGANQTAPLDAAGTRSALGLASANIDSQFTAIPDAVEAALVNEGDATALLQAIADKIASDLTAGDLTALAIVSAIKADATLATMIGRIDANISSRSSHSAPTEPLDAAGTRAAIGLSNADLDTQLAAIPDAVEAALVNEGDATALLQAIADKIAGDLTAGDLTALAIVSAIKADATLAAMIANIDTTISSRSSHSAPDLSNLDVAVSTRSSHSAPTEPLDAAGTRSALGLASANLDTQLAAQKDEICYALAVLAGTISNANGSTNTFQITRDGSTYTVTVSGVAETGNRTGQTLAKT